MKATITNLLDEEKLKKEVDKFINLTSEFFAKERINELSWEENGVD